MKTFTRYFFWTMLILFLAGTAMQAQQVNRFGFLDEFDNDVISTVWQDYESQYSFVEEDGKMKCTVNLAANSWKSFGLELPVPIDVTGAILQLRIKSTLAFPMMVKPEDKDGVADNWAHPTFSVDQSDDFLLYTFDFDANYGGEDTYDATNVKKIYFFFDPQNDFDGSVEFEYIAIGTLATKADMPYSGFFDDFDDDILVMDEPWSDYDETNYALSEANGVLSIACNSAASWTSFGLKFMDAPVDLELNPVLRIRMKSDEDFPMTIKFKDADGNWDQWGTQGHPVFNVEASDYFKTYTFDVGATMETGVDVYDLARIEEISFYFNANSAFVCNVEFDWFSMGSYNDQAQETVSGFYDDFSDDVLIMDEPWSDYEETNYALTEEDDVLKIACNTASSWKSFGLKFMESPLDLSDNPVIKLRMRSDQAFPMTIKFKDAEGNWDQWGTQGHPVFNVSASDYFITYTFDIGATMEAGVDVYDLTMIQEVSFYFNANSAFTCNVEFDWFSMGNTNPITNRLQTSLGQNFFGNGINLAWLEYGGKELTGFSPYEPEYVKALDSIALSGGNVIRWWLHTHTVNTPLFDGSGMCTGIQQTALDAIKRALDLAAERNIMVDLCLWTHNLLQTNAGEANYERNYKLISDPLYTQAYIDNALIPMVENVKGHSAILCWEIVNEPELLTGGHPTAPSEYIPTKEEIQQFINLQAGAIHRTDPSVAVSVGALSFNTCQSGSNWYTDDALIAQGGDEDGILDFYMAHYYGGGPNPFTNSPTDLGLTDRPVVIGEFSDLNESGTNILGGMTVAEAYQAAYDLGYAGVMAWKYFETPGDNTGNFTHHKPGIEAIYKDHPDEVTLISGDMNSSPYAKKIIPLLLVWPNENAWDSLDYVKLDTIFFDKEDAGVLTYTIESNSNPSLVTVTIGVDYTLDLSFPANAMGEAIITIKAEDSGGKTAKTTFRIYIVDTRNRALGATVKVSSVESASKLGSNALDGDPTTRFATLLGEDCEENEWLFVDLGEDYLVDSVVIEWEAAYGKQYKIYYAEEADAASTFDFLVNETLSSFVEGSWTLAYTETAGTGGTDVIPFTPALEARYIGFQGVERFNSEWGYSIYEFKVFSHGTVGIDDQTEGLIRVYPNPSDGYVFVSAPGKSWIEVMDITGRKVMETEHFNDLYRIDLSGYNQGVYLFRIHTKDTVSIERVVLR